MINVNNELGAPLSERAFFRVQAGVPLRARKVLAAAWARTKKNHAAHKRAAQGLYAEASLTIAEMNQACKET